MKTTWLGAAIAAAMLQSSFALAQPARGEAIIYEGANFSGRSIALRNDTANFENIGFNDRAASVYVVSGVWEFCNDAYYRDSCRTFRPGEYGDLGALTNRVSSGRLLNVGQPGWGPSGGPRTDPGNEWWNAGRGDVQLFDRQDFQGFLANLTNTAPNFEPLGYNDKVASLIVRRGTWEFCSDANFRGRCQTFGPGEYRRITGGQDDAFSSARPVSLGGATTRSTPERGAIQVFDHQDFSGRMMRLGDDAPNLENTGLNDRIESLIVERGRWRLCSDAYERGSCREFGPGRYPVLPPNLRSKISSLTLQ
ncbi:beta/gamma crystallin-related protein [Usitatibacter palustris]|uniref:Beta/gamma crystallin 'Greek key' domain-containing protein n=1 Tax=Usitatibacter palustris TaxID=2732487 RepID=A0A6M4HBU7_9PROT|nr:beta/gamma crystallin-related protein [Usitatibacter palustris]QJR15447.1 hypothetical protein DSM104440_02268 [Usitatibacter palustris]